MPAPRRRRKRLSGPPSISLPIYVFTFAARCFFFFNDTATTEIYTLSLHDALPIWCARRRHRRGCTGSWRASPASTSDRKSTRLNSSHVEISYAVFCLKKKKKRKTQYLYMRRKKQNQN